MHRSACLWCAPLLVVMASATFGQSAAARADIAPAESVALSPALLVDLDVSFIETRGDVPVLPPRFRSRNDTVNSVLTEDELAEFHHRCRSDRRITLHSVPRLRLRTGTPGEFRRGREIPYSVSPSSDTPTDSDSTELQSLFVGTSLDATVHGTREGMLQVDVVYQESHLTASPSRPGVKPEVDSTRVGSTVVLASGQTAVLGGWEMEFTSTRDARIPLIGKRPVIGPKWFTRTRTETDRRSQFLVVTPIVVEIER